VVSCLCNFTRGLINEEEDEEAINEEEAQKVLELYDEQIVGTVSRLLHLSIEKDYTPLQEETLALLSNISIVMLDKFAKHYNAFMPGLKQILATTPYETDKQKDLRANCI